MAGSQCHIEIMNAVIGRMHVPEMTVNYKTSKFSKLLKRCFSASNFLLLVLRLSLSLQLRKFKNVFTMDRLHYGQNFEKS